MRSFVGMLACGGLVLARAALAQTAPGDPAALPPEPPPPPPAQPAPPQQQPMPPQEPMPPQPMGQPMGPQGMPPRAVPPIAIAMAPLARTHHGVFFRGLLGAGGFQTSSTQGTDSYKVSGSGGGLGLALGGAVTPSLIVYGEVFDDVASSPTFTMNGQMSSSGSDVRAGVVGFGPGLAYYFPSNFYLGGALVAARLTIQQNGQEIGRSDTGVGVDLHVGKEWWVSDSWGIGLALQLFVGSIPDNQVNASWKTSGGTLAFSATYN